MAKVNKGIPKKRGRPATGKDPVVPVRLPVVLIKQIDAWGKKQQEAAKTRSEAIRRLVEVCLRSDQLTQVRSKRGPDKSADMAGQTIDRLTDSAATPEDQAKRKRRLLKGPSEFREMRDDQPRRLKLRR